MQARGFTLIEVLMAVAIVGMLASMSITEYTKFAAKARRTEAISALTVVRDAQIAFRVEHDRYAVDFRELGFEIKGGVRKSSTEVVGRRYTYQITADDDAWCVSATGNIDGDAYIDVVVIGNGCGG